MARRPISVHIKRKDITKIEKFLRSGVQQVRVTVRALALSRLVRL